MMHPDFVVIDECFSDRETTDREMYLEKLNEEWAVKEPKTIKMKMYVHSFIHSLDGDIYLYSADMSDVNMACLGAVEVTFTMPEKDLVTAKVESLENCMQKKRT